ncbi:hypothetical protein EDC01DRAFT_635891 [Geopyxis carbonaria]|nr:hypothetical protein EDC01DRAFT_635891 [Geopyxis carbonaria]
MVAPPHILLALAAVASASAATLSSCLTTAAVPYLSSSSPGWRAATIPFNRRFNPTPSLLATPRTLPEASLPVQATVRCAAAAGTQLSVRSGGHSYGAYALAAPLVLDLSAFQSVSVNSTSNVATVGAGIRLGNMAIKLYNAGARAVPHGTCPGVGIGGHATLGGFGFASRMWGLTVDNVVGLTAVLGDGSVTAVNLLSNADLFWALRGAGAGFAVVTEFQLRTWPAPASSVKWAYTYEFPDPAVAAQAWMAVQVFGLEEAPVELGLEVLLMPEATLVVTGVYYGARAAFNALLAPLLAELRTRHGAPPVETAVASLGWLPLLAALGEGPTLEQPAAGYNLSDTFYAKSLEVPQATPLTLDAMTALLEYAWNTPAPSDAFWMVLVELYGGAASAVTTGPASPASYARRDTGHVLQFYANTADNAPPWDDAIVGFVNGLVDALGVEGGAYPPYADPELGTGDAARERYWGANVARLKAIKAAVDPGRVVFAPQGF